MLIRLQVSIMFYCSRMLYYHSWMVYNHFIIILYHFLVLTYWHSAKWQLLFFACFLLCTKSIPNGVQMQWNFLENFSRREGTTWAKEVPEGSPQGGTTLMGALGGLGTPWWAVPTSVASCTTSLPYKYPNIPETLGESTKHNSSRRKF